jgi:hypothetical protein
MKIQKTFLNFSHAYRAITNPVSQSIRTVHKSGTSKNIKNKIAFSTTKAIKNSFLSTKFLFLKSRLAKNITYHNLKNSAGCILGNQGIFIHHLAQFKTIPTHGINTASCSAMIAIAIIFTFLLFWKNFIGTL